MSELKAVIFDIDGVLHDGVAKYFESLELFMKEKGIQSKEGMTTKLNGRSIKDIYAILLEEYGINGNTSEYEEKVGTSGDNYIHNEYKPAAELLAFLKELKENNIPIALATSNVPQRAFLIIEKLSMQKEDFSAIITAEHVHKAKPDPAIYVLTAKKLGVKPEDCVVFEDAPNGITAAKITGMKTIAVKTRIQTTQELSEANLVINNFGEVNIPTLKKLFTPVINILN